MRTLAHLSTLYRAARGFQALDCFFLVSFYPAHMLSLVDYLPADMAYDRTNHHVGHNLFVLKVDCQEFDLFLLARPGPRFLLILNLMAPLRLYWIALIPFIWHVVELNAVLLRS